MSSLSQQTVRSVHHWSDTLFSFTTTRDRGFRFKSGHFVMIGLPVEGKPLLRAFSVASASYEDHLEFYGIKLPDGPLSSRLRQLRAGDPILVSSRPAGTLVIHNVRPGKRLYLLATGTGLAPFLSIIRDPETYERFEHVIVVHGVRYVSELGYADYIRDELPRHEAVGEQVRTQLRYYPTVTREPYAHQGRITDAIASGTLTRDVGMPAFDPAHDRAMICGSPSMLADTSALLDACGFREGSSHEPGDYTIERAFVER